MVILTYFAFVGVRAAFGASIPPTFEIDLDLPPEKRWQGALDVVLSEHSFEHGFQVTFAAHNESLFGNINRPEAISNPNTNPQDIGI